MKRLEDHSVLLNREKCEVGLRRIEYLGHVLSGEGISPTQEKIVAIKEAKPPTDVKGLRSLLGMVNYYGKYMPNLSTTMAPLYDLLKKGASWEWGEKQQEALEQVKGTLTSETLLIHYSKELPLVLSCDASQYGLGAVMGHLMPEGGGGGETNCLRVQEAKQRGNQLFSD